MTRPQWAAAIGAALIALLLLWQGSRIQGALEAQAAAIARLEALAREDFKSDLQMLEARLLVLERFRAKQEAREELEHVRTLQGDPR